MKNIKYLILGIVLTLTALFVFLNQQELRIDFLFIEVVTSIYTAIIVAFFLGLFSGILIVLMGRSHKKEVSEEKPVRPKMTKEDSEEVHGIPLK